MKKAVFIRFSVVVSAVAMIIVCGCSVFEVNNNYLQPVDFVRQLHKDGIKVKTVKQLDHRPLSAASAIELEIGNSNIGVYKYDKNIAAHRKRLENIKKSKRIYFNGIPYPVYEVSGSFIVVGLDKHKDKKRILESLRNFR